MANSSDIITENIREILSRFEENLNVACEQLSEYISSRCNPDFDFDLFWTNLSGVTKLLSHESSKFCMAFNGSPLTSTEECQSLLDKIEEKCLALVTVFFSLPKSKGKLLHKKVRVYVLSLLQSLKTLCASTCNGRNTLLQNVGEIWETCEAVESLPKDNRDAVLAFCQEQCDMVQDASQELVDAIENERDASEENFSTSNEMESPPQQSWTASDRNILLPSSGLVKAAKACIKKVSESIRERGDGRIDEARMTELDVIVEIVQNISPVVDDLVLSLYPPMNHSAAREEAASLRNICKELLTTVKTCHFCATADEAWVEFLEKAVDHNFVKINDLALAD